MTALLLKLAGSLSPKAWGWVLVIVLALASIAFVFHAGESHVQKQARAAVTAKAVDVLVAKTAVLDTAQRAVVSAKGKSTATKVVRDKANLRVTIVSPDSVKVDGQAVSADTAIAALVALVQADSAKIAADSVTMKVGDAREAAHMAVDTANADVRAAQANQIKAGDTEGGHGTAVVVVLAVVGGMLALLALFH